MLQIYLVINDEILFIMGFNTIIRIIYIGDSLINGGLWFLKQLEQTIAQNHCGNDGFLLFRSVPIGETIQHLPYAVAVEASLITDEQTPNDG